MTTEKYLSAAQRFFLQAPMLLPFVMYEYRTGSPDIRKTYDFNYIFNIKNFRKIYRSSLG